MPNRVGRLLLSALMVIVSASVADARITIRTHTPYDTFLFHGNYSLDPFSPTDEFGMEIWNCANGQSPTLVADRVERIVCRDPSGITFTDANLVYAIDLPAGACVDHGRSCYYRNSDVPSRTSGVRYLRVQYSRHGRGNRVWLESYGDLSSAQQARMLVLIKIAGISRAVLEDTFTPLPSGGWFSPF